MQERRGGPGERRSATTEQPRGLSHQERCQFRVFNDVDVVEDPPVVAQRAAGQDPSRDRLGAQERPAVRGIHARERTNAGGFCHSTRGGRGIMARETTSSVSFLDRDAR